MQKLILIEDVDGLGRRGSLVRAKDGYSRNFLLPKQLAVVATRDNLKRLEGLRKKFQEEEKVRVEKAKGLLERMQDLSVTITVKASEEGHLYGSVNTAVLVEALAAKDLVVDPRVLKLAEPIKEIGVYQVPVVLHDDVRTELKVWVVKEAAPGEVVAETGEAAAATEGEPAAEADPAKPAAEEDQTEPVAGSVDAT